MNISSASNSPRAQLERLLADVRKLKGDVNQQTTGYADSFYDAEDAGRDLQSCQFPLRRAQSDTVNTDVSWEGREIERNVNQAEQELRNNDYRLGRLEGNASTIASEFSTNQATLQQLIADCSAYPTVVSSLRQAAEDLRAGSADHGSGSNEARWGKQRGGDAQRELQWSDMYVRNICYDRVGVDVSSDARQAGFRVDNANWNLRDCSQNLRQANGYESRSGQEVGQAENHLQQALAEMPR